MDSKKGRLTMVIDDDVKRLFKMWCLRNNVTMSQVFEDLASSLVNKNTLAEAWYKSIASDNTEDIK